MMDSESTRSKKDEMPQNPSTEPTTDDQKRSYSLPVKDARGVDAAKKDILAYDNHIKAHANAQVRANKAKADRDAMESESSKVKYEKQRKIFLNIWIAVGTVVLVGVLVYLLHILSIPVSMAIWTLIFVFCLRGIVSKFNDMGMNRGIATTLAYVIMFLVLAVLLVLAFSPMFGLNTQFENIITSMPHYMDSLKAWSEDIYSKYANWLDNDTIRNAFNEVSNSISSWASSLASGAANTVVDLGTTVANSLMAIGFGLVIAFWILMQLPAIGAETKRLISPRRYEDAHFLHITFTRIMGGYIKGTLLQCIIIGVACGIVFAIAGVPNAPALGVITGVMNIIPIVGPWLGGALAAIAALFTSPIAAIISLVGTIIIQQIVYTFISPKIMQNSVDVHPAITLAAMMIGSALGGAMDGLLGSLVGMLFSIPAAAVIKSCFVYYFEKRTGRQLVSEDGVFFKGKPGSTDGVDPLGDATSAPARPEPRRGKDILPDPRN